MRLSVHAIGGLTITEPRWMISMLESVSKIGIMTCLIKKMMKRLDSPLPGPKIEMPMPNTNLEWKIDHLVGVELEDRRHSADFRGRTMPRPPPPPPPVQGSGETTALTPEMIQQAMQRLFFAYKQCVTRVAQTDDRLEQFRSTIRRDALDLTLNVQRNSQDLQHQGQKVERIKRTLFSALQGKVNHLEEKLRMLGDDMDGVAKTIDRNEQSKCASITVMVREQKDIRQLVGELAKRLDQPREMTSTTQGEISTALQLEISDLKAKVLRLTEQNTEQDGKLDFLASMSEQVDLMEQQIIKWRYRLPDLTDDDIRERVAIAVEVKKTYMSSKV